MAAGAAPTDMLAEAGFPASVIYWIDRIVATAAALVATGALAFLFIILMLEVVVRYLTTQGLGWPAEMPNLLFPWLVMGGIVLAAQRGSHIAVTALLDKLPASVARLLLLVMQLIITGTFAYLGWVGIKILAITGSETYPISGLSSSWAYLAVVVGFFGIALTALTTAVRVLIANDPRLVRAPDPEDEQ
ncbi:MAG: TRAP transporter small permease [Xanthobacter sp.]